MVDITEVGENIFMIDSQLYSIEHWGSVYLINEEKKALIDSGPATSSNVVVEGIKKVGIKPSDIDYIIVTHIHLDHAGGAGVLIQDMPRAKVLVHYRGARHLINPNRLIQSMVEVQGHEALIREGDVLPIAENRVKPLYNGDEIRMSENHVLQVIDAPGHAQHELCIYDCKSKGVFTGDAAGIYIQGIVLPATAPPNFNMEQWLNTLDGLMNMHIEKLYFAHYGVANKAEEVLQSSVEKMYDWYNTIEQAKRGNHRKRAAEQLLEKARNELEPIREQKALYDYLTCYDIPSSVNGYIRYIDERNKA